MGLRERQRAFTEETIRLTAVRLFLCNGSAATTVEEIADAAGVSSRTFFRYFDTKESAALPSLVPFEEALHYLSPAGTGLTHLLSSLDDVLVALIEEAALLEAPASRDLFLLLEKDPAVRDAAGAHTLRLTDTLLTALHRAAPAADPLTLRVLAGNRVATMQAVWSHWHCAAREADWDTASVELPTAVYRRAVTLLDQR